MKKTSYILVVLAFSLATALPSASYEVIRISVASLKNFGDSKASDIARLRFIADRIAEQAIKGVAVADELQDKDGSAMTKLQDAVSKSAHTPIRMEMSDRVGGGNKEQYGFFWNPEIVALVGSVETIYFDEIERDPWVATFKAKAGFDFTLCAFHTRPSGKPLKDELRFLDNAFEAVQSASAEENDIIFVGDFNAPPEPNPATSQKLGIARLMGTFSSNIYFVIRDRPTNVKQDKIFDNIFFDKRTTDEYIPEEQHVVRIDTMLHEYTADIPGDDPVGWFLKNVMDHCPVYAHSRADMDTD